MEIGKYISQALKIHPTIYVEQLGVFRKVHRPSTYDKSRQVYLPPLDYVEFDSLDQEGFSLSTFVQQSDNIQKTEAKALVENGVKSLRTIAEEDGEVYLDTLGHLVQYGNALIFKPQDLTGFALEPIPYVSEEDDTVSETADEDSQESYEPPVTDEEPAIEPQAEAAVENIDTTEPVPEDNPVEQEETSSDESHTPHLASRNPQPATRNPEEDSAETEEEPEIAPVGIFNAEEAVPEETSSDDPRTPHPASRNPQPATRNPEPQEDQPEEITESRKSNRGLWFVLAALLALIIIGGLWYYNNHMVQKENEDTSAAPDDGLTERPMTIPTDTSSTEDTYIFSTDPTDTTSQMRTPETPTQETPEVALPANHRWYIVIGAHRSLSQAEDEVESYRKQGHPRVRMLPKSPSDTFIRVIWDSYVTKQEADSALRHVQQNHVSDAWHRERKNFN